MKSTFIIAANTLFVALSIFTDSEHTAPVTALWTTYVILYVLYEMTSHPNKRRDINFYSGIVTATSLYLISSGVIFPIRYLAHGLNNFGMAMHMLSIAIISQLLIIVYKDYKSR